MEDLTTKDLIRETALTLFRENGYDEVTIMQICKACGITKRTFYYHYESKAQLLNGVVDFLGMKAEKLLLTMTEEKSNVQILWELMSVYCTNSISYGPYIMKQVYITMFQENSETHFPEDMYLYQIAVRLITNAQKSGEIKIDTPAKTIAFTLYHILRSVSMTWAAENGAPDLTEEFRKAFCLILGCTPENLK